MQYKYFTLLAIFLFIGFVSSLAWSPAAGGGSSSSNSTFNATYNNLLGQNCPVGRVVNGTLANGTLICTTDQTGSGTQNNTNIAFTNNSNIFTASNNTFINLTALFLFGDGRHLINLRIFNATYELYSYNQSTAAINYLNATYGRFWYNQTQNIYNATYNNLLGQHCPVGRVVNGTLANGTLICTPDQTGTGTQNNTNIAFTNRSESWGIYNVTANKLIATNNTAGVTSIYARVIEHSSLLNSKVSIVDSAEREVIGLTAWNGGGGSTGYGNFIVSSHCTSASTCYLGGFVGKNTFNSLRLGQMLFLIDGATDRGRLELSLGAGGGSFATNVFVAESTGEVGFGVADPLSNVHSAGDIRTDTGFVAQTLSGQTTQADGNCNTTITGGIITNVVCSPYEPSGSPSSSGNVSGGGADYQLAFWNSPTTITSSANYWINKTATSPKIYIGEQDNTLSYIGVDETNGESIGDMTLYSPTWVRLKAPEYLLDGLSQGYLYGFTSGTGVTIGTVATLPTFNQTYNNLLGQNCPVGRYVNGTLSNGTLICNPLPSQTKIIGEINRTSRSVVNFTYLFDFTMLATTNYSLDCDLWVSSNVTTTGVQINVSTTGTNNGLTINFQHPTTATGYNQLNCVSRGTMLRECYDNSGTSTLESAPTKVDISGTILQNTTGILNVTFRSEIQNSFAIVHRGSKCRLNII